MPQAAETSSGMAMNWRSLSRRAVRPADVPHTLRILVVAWVVAAALVSLVFVRHGAWPVALAELAVVCALWAAFAATRR
jgi:uncharacterized membrane protein